MQLGGGGGGDVGGGGGDRGWAVRVGEGQRRGSAGKLRGAPLAGLN